MKQRYEKADAEVILFNNSDVVTTSPGGEDGEENHKDWPYWCQFPRWWRWL